MDNENTNTTTTNDAPSPLEQLEALRANTVDKAEYERVVAERNQMFQSLATQPRTNAAPEAPKVDTAKRMAELRAGLGLYGEDCQLSNLDYWKDTLELRELILDQGGRDPFLPYGKDNAIDDDDIKTANRIAAGVQSCIDYADGDRDIFTNELQRIIVDTPIARMASRANR